MRPITLALLFLAGCTGSPISIGNDNNGVLAAHCSNGVLDADETDIDCGGPACLGCELMHRCQANTDCKSALCHQGLCADGHDAGANGGDNCGIVPCHLANATATCVNNACAIGSCDHGFGDCDGDAHNGCETNLASDTNDCGACGVVCQHGQTCQQGVCGGGMGGCNMPCNFPNGVGQCVNNACALASCNHGFGDCDRDPHNGCEVNLASDAHNCGACGVVCANGAACMAGACVQNNGCGNVMCVFQNGVGQCLMNTCVLTSCNPLFADCDRNQANGCEVSLANDPNNCGGCGTACPNGQLCMGGACVQNNLCGGVMCNLANATATCVMNTCQISHCSAGFADCNGNAHDGCETRVSNDPNNCGACGNVCVMGATCVNAMCTQNNGGCMNGFADCDRLAANGCETNVAIDAQNCGACGVACANGKTCHAGVCQ